MTMIKYLAGAGAALAVTLGSFSAMALTVTPTGSGDTLVQSILGPGVSYSNVVYTGTANSGGTFAGAGAAVGIDSGILLTSGAVQNAVGPNNTGSASTSNNTPGDSQLNTLIPGYSTNDATSLSFNFTTSTGDLFFNYVFASEEYPEWVGTSYNDVFGFFVDGVNIALIPGTSTPVAINTVNSGSNAAYYVPNNGSLNTQYDALTTVLTASVLGLSAGTHTIKLAIADAGDTSYDSGVFIKAGSFSSTNPTSDVPELDAVSSASALMLLLIGGLMITGRKRQAQLSVG